MGDFNEVLSINEKSGGRDRTDRQVKYLMIVSCWTCVIMVILSPGAIRGNLITA